MKLKKKSIKKNIKNDPSQPELTDQTHNLSYEARIKKQNKINYKI
jgi:hypothetical protein